MTDGIQSPEGDVKPKSKRGGVRPGAGRKPGTAATLSCAQVRKIANEIAGSEVVSDLLSDAAFGDIRAVRQLWALYSRAERIGLDRAKGRAGGASAHIGGKP
jgi:hypothetical protein